MVVTYKITSPYVNTPQRNFLVEHLEFYENRPVPADDSDDLIALSPKHEFRPDLLSTELYGTPNLWWIFSVRNPNLIVDPIYDLKSGIEIFVPTKNRVFNNILGL